MKQMLVLAPVPNPLNMDTYEIYDAKVSEMSMAVVEQLGEYVQVVEADISSLIHHGVERIETGNYLEYLSRMLRDMKHREYVVFSKGWEENREHRILHYIATEYGIKVLEV